MLQKKMHHTFTLKSELKFPRSIFKLFIIIKLNVLKKIIFVFVFAFSPVLAYSQNFKASFGKGLTVTSPDSSVSLKFSARFQMLYIGTRNLDTDKYTDAMLIRRARLKFDGFVYNPNIRFKMELGQSNRDTGGGNRANFNNTSNIILDAVLKVKFGNGWDFWVGQTKLPGNRERVISSQKLQMVDRSLMNAWFNIDRDIGIQLHHKGKIGNIGVLKEAFAVTTGEGRDVITTNIGGYSYTGRLEYLPFGEFTNKGDYFGSDLEREPTGKLSIGATYNFNDGAGRTRGQLGSFMLDSNEFQFTNDLSVLFLDLYYKNRGFSLLSEYANKKAENKVVASLPEGDLKYGTGTGFMVMAGYLFRNNLEITGRYTNIESDDEAFSSVITSEDYVIGLSKYIVRHALKIQTDLGYRDRKSRSDFLTFRFQIELAL